MVGVVDLKRLGIVMANDWYVPMLDMKQTINNRSRRDNGCQPADKMWHCLSCGVVYQEELSNDKKKVNSTGFEYYPQGVMSTYEVEKKECPRCS
jgi:hypothetical protein